MLGSANPSYGTGRDVRVLDVLSSAETKLAGLGAEPEIQAAIQETLGNTYFALGQYGKAETLLKAALETQRRLLGPDNPDLVDLMNDLARAEGDGGDEAGAEALNRTALAISRAARGRQRDALLHRSLNDLAVKLKRRGDFVEAEKLYRESIAILQGMGPVGEKDLAVDLNNLGELFRSQGRPREAEPVLREALELNRRVRGSEHPEVATNLNNLALVLSQLYNWSEAESMARQALALDRKLLGEEHPYVSLDLQNLAAVLLGAGVVDEADSLAREALARRRRIFGERHLNVAACIQVLGRVRLKKADLDGARAFTEALEIREKARGRDHFEVAEVLGRLAEVDLARGRLAEAASSLAEATRIMRRADHPNQILGARLHSEYGYSLYRLGRFSEAEAELRLALPILEGALGRQHPEMQKAVGNVVALYEAWGKPEKAREWRAKLEAQDAAATQAKK